MTASRSYGGAMRPMPRQFTSMIAAFSNQSHCVTVDFDQQRGDDPHEGFAFEFGPITGPTGPVDLTRRGARRATRV